MTDLDIDAAIWHLKGTPEDFDLARRLIRRVFAAQGERNAALEEAAQIADNVNTYDNPMTSRDVADAIRELKVIPAAPGNSMEPF